jgi:DNA-binding CsgD family transcriptional regulator
VPNTLSESRIASVRSYAMINGMLDMLTIGIACIRVDGEVMYANKSGLELLYRSNLIPSKSDLPLAKVRICGSILKKLNLNKHETILIKNHSCELQIQVAPFSNQISDKSLKFERRRGAMLILHESGRVDLPSKSELISLFGLTQAESKLAIKLCGGHTPKECAEYLGVSITTIRTHLRGLMEKTKSRRQSELLTKLLSAPSARVNTE